MRMSIIIPVMGQPHELKGVVSTVFKNATTDYETIIVDNSTQEHDRQAWRKFLSEYLKPNHLRYHSNEGNIGMVKTMQQGYELASGDVLAFLHSDLFVYTHGWDKIVLEEFESDTTIGLAGFFGQAGMHYNAGRENTMSNMVEAEIHGQRVTESKFIITVDGFSIICRKEMLDKIGGFDQDYEFHHVYDKNIGMDSLAAGYRNKYIPISVHHWSGKTANSPEYQGWINEKRGRDGGDLDTMNVNLDIFNRKWGHCLPLRVDPNTGQLNREVTKR